MDQLAIAQAAHDRAWTDAIEAVPGGWFGPRIEPRAFNRWMAWIDEANEPKDRIAVFGPTEVEALEALTKMLQGGVVTRLRRIPIREPVSVEDGS